MATSRTNEALRVVEEAAFDAFLTAAIMVQRCVDADLESEHRRSLTDYTTLRRLSEANGQRLRRSHLAAAIHMQVSTVSRIVERLERDGLVTREPGPRDRRGWQAVITDEGRRLLRRAERTYADSMRRHVLDCVDREDLAALAAVVRRPAERPSPADMARGGCT